MVSRKTVEEILSSEGGSVMLSFDPRFPIDDVRAIAKNLEGWDFLTPGFRPPTAGLFHIDSLMLEANFDDSSTVILPDRNLVTRMAKIAQYGMSQSPSMPDLMAANLMAFAQSFDFQIDPTIAFYELASRKGNQVAAEELGWFRAADEPQATAWIGIAMGRHRSLKSASPVGDEMLDFSEPLMRWERNYVVALKIAEFELSNLPNLEKLLGLLRWMVEDFIYAGPAGCFAAMYFSSTSQRAGMIKQLRSPDRGRALAGIKNAAWDITYLSEFIRKSRDPENSECWQILATADKNLSSISELMTMGANVDAIAKSYSKWWPLKEAYIIANELIRIAKHINQRPMRRSMDGVESPVETHTRSGEAFILTGQFQ
jgi:hypothetical protein